MSIVVFYLLANGQPACYKYKDHELQRAQNWMLSLERQGMTHIVMSNEPDDTDTNTRSEFWERRSPINFNRRRDDKEPH